MKATTLLRTQHAEARKLFAVVTSDGGNRKAAAQEVSRKLLAHMIIEQSVLYPAIKEVDADLVLEAFEEHAVARYEIRRLLESLDDPRFEARGTTLKELIEHHVKEEEEELFPKVEKALPAAKLEAMGGEMEALFAELSKADMDTLMQRSRRTGEDGSRNAAA